MDTIMDLVKGVVNSINNGAWRIVAAGLILLAVQVAKTYLPKVTGKWAWLVAVGLGALWGLGTGLGQATVTVGAVLAQVVNGLAVGLAGVGMFEGAKNAKRTDTNSVSTGTIETKDEPPKDVPKVIL